MTPPLPQTMQAMAIENGTLVAVEQPLPIPAAGEVLIRVAYAGVNRADLLQIAGDYLPPEGASPLPGLEVSGWVVAQGDGVHGFSLNAPVCALLSGGGYAGYVAVPAAHVLPLPAGIGLKEAATLPEAAATSMMALLQEGALKAGERVLLHGGTSGVGLLMGQIARARGAEVFATVGSAEKAAFLRPFGIRPMNYHTAPFGEHLLALTEGVGVDVIIDTLGGPALPAHLRCLRRGGRLVSLAMLEGSTIPAGTKMTRLLMNHLSWHGATLRRRSAAEKAALMAEIARIVWPMLADGAVKPVIDRCFALPEAKKACARMQERLHMGKILLEVQAE
ncbi:MAG: NAD(P)H-quinone oxidoreductase [Alphaproteobacteria bacterium]|nr:NAD(P)H-quinone oxidoreductase [Alphaproteobacteria bacterium]